MDFHFVSRTAGEKNLVRSQRTLFAPLPLRAFICLDDLGEFRKEIRHLHEKIDHLLRRQYNRLFEIQQIQIELLVRSVAFRRRLRLL
jgi:hypothetical protein